jgi:hypothetical protein
VLPTGGKFKFGGDPNVKVDIGGGLGGSSTIGSKNAKKYDFSKIPSVTAPLPPISHHKAPLPHLCFVAIYLLPFSMHSLQYHFLCGLIARAFNTVEHAEDEE